MRVPSELDKATWVSSREGETRIGQEVHFCTENDESWKNRRFHVLGICEDLGPRANGGFGGSDKAFTAFIQRFMAVQSNRFLKGDDIAIHGTIVPSAVQSVRSLHELVSELDTFVTQWGQEVITGGGIPIVIGGGHNNAYGLIRGASLAFARPVAVINLDPHADTRELEGRHSGNPFSYAWEHGFMKSYTVLGLHQSYNNEAILQRLDAMNADCTFFEEWIDEHSYHEAILQRRSLLSEETTGIELDLDSIQFMPSSAFTPSGITVEQARFYVRQMASLKQACYLHLPEGAPQNEREEAIVGKTLVYLVTDFIKCSITPLEDRY